MDHHVGHGGDRLVFPSWVYDTTYVLGSDFWFTGDRTFVVTQARS